MAYKVNFSIPEEDKEVHEHLAKMKRNKSRYIVDLIKKDLGLIRDNNLNNINENRLNELIENKVKELMNAQEGTMNKGLEDLNKAIKMNNSDDDFM